MHSRLENAPNPAARRRRAIVRLRSIDVGATGSSPAESGAMRLVLKLSKRNNSIGISGDYTTPTVAATMPANPILRRPLTDIPNEN